MNSNNIILKFALVNTYNANAKVISITVPKDGYYLMVAYIQGGAVWLDGVTDSNSANFLKLNSESSCSKILYRNEGDIVSLVNLTGSACTYYQSSYLGLIELTGNFTNLNE